MPLVNAQGLQAEKRDARLQLTLDGKSIGQFVYRDAKIRRPYFANLALPGGPQITRNHPPVADVDAVDHDTMHPGVWLAFGDLCGVDFWRNKGSIEHVRFIDEPHVVDGQLSFGTECQFRNEQGDAIGQLQNRFRLSALSTGGGSDTTSVQAPSGWLLVWEATLIADRQPILMGDQEEMGFGARVATPLTEKKGGQIVNSHGVQSAAKTWGQAADWCDYSGIIDGKPVGIAIMTSRKNSYPSWWHNRDYGLMVANPFGRKAMKQGERSEIKIETGQSLSLRFGACIHRESPTDYERLLQTLEQ